MHGQVKCAAQKYATFTKHKEEHMPGYPVMYKNNYHTPEDAHNFLAKHFPGIFFYPSMLRTVGWASQLAKSGKLDNCQWVRSSLAVIRAFERSGIRFHFENLQAFTELHEPCVFIGNHMSTLETFVLPAIIQPYKDITFVVKKSLTEYPFFKWVMRSRKPVIVERTNPREDLKTVLEEGQKRLESGISVIVFPQSTRSLRLDPKQFNTIGIKLAKRAGVPVVPLALRTDAWGMGNILKDFGSVIPENPVHFRFGPPVNIEGNGKSEHAHICEFITKSLVEWGIS